MLFPRKRKSPAEAEERRRLRSAKRRRFMIVSTILVAIMALLTWLLLQMPAELDDRRVSIERQQRALQAALGTPLAGTPDLANLSGRLDEKGMKLGTPIFMRIFKREFELELWMMKDGRFEHFVTYPICRWSGKLGPKLATGDHQAPEGFYSVDKTALNPNSRWRRSFNLGFPNPYDRAHQRTGSFLMVHGGCSSVGCYAMTDPVIDEIWTIVTQALDGGQKRFQVQAFPFRMTEANLDRYAGHALEPFWRNLKTGHDLFEHERIPPVVGVCDKSYAFRPGRPAGAAAGQVLATCLPKDKGTAAEQNAQAQLGDSLAGLPQ